MDIAVETCTFAIYTYILDIPIEGLKINVTVWWNRERFITCVN